MPRWVKSMSKRLKRKPLCDACHHWHIPGAAHLGDPRDWSFERINCAPHREELSGGVQLLQDDLRALPGWMTWRDRVAVGVYRRADDVPLSWLPRSGVASDADRTVYVAPPGAEARLHCGIVLQLTARGGVRHQAVTDIASGAGDPLVIVSITGCWLEMLEYPSAAEDETSFLARGERLIHRLTETGRRAGMRIAT